jgi:hypothetical protein
MELKPCPFCGGEVNEARDAAGFYNYFCTKCPCRLTGDYEHHATARAVWNGRKQESKSALDAREIRFARLLAEMQGDELLSEQQCAKAFDVDLVSWRIIAHTFSRGTGWVEGDPLDSRNPTTEEAILSALDHRK